MDLCHQSSAMRIIMLRGEDKHPWPATKESREPITSHYPSRRVTKKTTNKLLAVGVWIESSCANIQSVTEDRSFQIPTQTSYCPTHW